MTRLRRTTRTSFFIRVDHRLTQHDNLFVRYGLLKSTVFDAARGPAIRYGKLPAGAECINSRDTSVTPAILNQFQVGYNRFSSGEPVAAALPDVAAKLAISGADQTPSLVGFPVVSITGYAGIGKAL